MQMLDAGHVLRFIKRESWLVSMGGCGTACVAVAQHAWYWMVYLSI